MPISQQIKELEAEQDRLNAEMEEMEEIYGDHFPEPSAQLDQWNRLYDRYWEVINKIELLKREGD